jgi:hypothetical protein
MKKDENLVAVLDILGYSDLMLRHSLDTLETIIVNGLLGTLLTAKIVSGEYVVVANEVADENELIEYSELVQVEYGIISDTIVLYPKVDIEKPLTTLCITVSVLMSELLNVGILLRGGIEADTFRAVEGHTIYIGRAIIGAHKLEIAQNWAGCVLTRNVVRKFPKEIKKLRSDGLIVEYDIPLKQAPNPKEWSRLAINWFYYRIGEHWERRERLYRQFVDAPESAQGKVMATINFLRYLETLGKSYCAPLSRKALERSRVRGEYKFASWDAITRPKS